MKLYTITYIFVTLVFEQTSQKVVPSLCFVAFIKTEHKRYVVYIARQIMQKMKLVLFKDASSFSSIYETGLNRRKCIISKNINNYCLVKRRIGPNILSSFDHRQTFIKRSIPSQVDVYEN